MIERELLDTAKIPGGDELRLFRRPLKNGPEYSIALGSNELMNSRLSASEEALATLTCAQLKSGQPQILIGGYGMGFTLRAAQKNLTNHAKIDVAELVPEIIEWARNQMQDLTTQSLEDPRVTIMIDDVTAVISRSGAKYDAILLDVDNGPDGLTNEANDRLYGMTGLALAKKALRSGGVLAIWSSAKDAAFTGRLHQSGFSVKEETVTARPNGKGARHNIWLASKD
ncbi:MAG: spermidine synthase [Parasphingorhabdus sp.]